MPSDTPIVSVDMSRCVRCGRCESVCPNSVFKWGEAHLESIHPGRCIRCGHCVAVCAEDAFVHHDIKQAFQPLTGESPVSTEHLQGLFEQRRSCRLFTDESISADMLTSILAAAGRAPSATNSQNVRYIALDTRERISALAEMTARYYRRLAGRMENPLIRFVLRLTVGKRLVENYRFHLPVILERFQTTGAEDISLFYNAPLVLVAISSGLPHIASANANLATMQMMLKAETLGLGTVYNGYALTALLRDRRIAKAMGIRKGYLPCAVIAMGRPAITFYKTPPRRAPRVIRPFD